MFAPRSNTNQFKPNNNLFGGTSNGFIQPKLNIGTPGDKYEVEADRAADQIVAKGREGVSTTPFIAPSTTIQKQPEEEIQTKEKEEVLVQEKPVVDRITPLIQKKNSSEEIIQNKCSACATEEKVQKKEVHSEIAPIQKKISKPLPVQKKCSCEDKDTSIQKKEEGEQETMNEALEQIQKEKTFESKLKGKKGKGKKLDKNTKAKMESGFGADFSKVNIHTDSEAVQMSQDMGAQAFTNGNDIFFNKGKYNPNSEEGTHLLAHELTHTVQQGESDSKDIQKIELPGFVQDGLDAVTGTYNNAVDAVADGIYNVTEALGVTDEVLEAYEAAEELYDEATEYLVKARDWLVSAAGTAARSMVEALGGTIDVTEEGIIVTFPETCPVPAMDMSVPVPPIQQDLMAPVFVIPVVAGIIDGVITGELGGTLALEPQLDMQVGPFCLEGARMVINPLTNNYSVEGGVSAMAGVSLGAEIRGGVKAAMSFHGIILAGEIPIPVSIELIGVEAGLAGLGRGIGVGRQTLSGGLAYSNGSLVMNSVEENEIGLAADAFVGTYGQLSIGGFNFCRLYWEPYSWHGDIGAYFQTTSQVVIGANPSYTSNSTATIGEFPFHDYEVLLNRGGFEDDCVIEDIICWLMDKFDLYPSNNGGKWEIDGQYGAGGRLEGTVEGLPVFNRTPNDARGELGEDSPLCRGACGANCNTCDSHETYTYTDEETGETWEYTNFEDCSTHEGCQQHDAGFDKALVEHQEDGPLDIVFGEYHAYANFECMCTYPLGNCFSWIAGGPPSQGRMYFADSARKLGDSENVADNELEAKIEAISVYFFDKDPEEHRLFIVIEGGEAELMMQSDEGKVEAKIDEKEEHNPTEAEKRYLEIAESHRRTIDGLVEIHLQQFKGNEGEEEIESIVEEIREELVELGGYLREGGVDYFPDLPATLITYKKSGGKPKSVTASPLTFKQGSHVGSPPQENPAGWGLVEKYMYFDVFIDKNKKKGDGRQTKIDTENEEVAKRQRAYAAANNFPIFQTTDWVRFHILNENLHGPGVFWNLLSASTGDNNTYKSTIETPIKNKVGEKGPDPLHVNIQVSQYRNHDNALTVDNVHESVTKPEEREEIVRLYGEIPESLSIEAVKMNRIDEEGQPIRYEKSVDPKDKVLDAGITVPFSFSDNIDITKKKGSKVIVLMFSGVDRFKTELAKYMRSQRATVTNVSQFVENFFHEDQPSRSVTTITGYLQDIINELNKSNDTETITLFDGGVTSEEITALEKEITLLKTSPLTPQKLARLTRVRTIINEVKEYLLEKSDSDKEPSYKQIGDVLGLSSGQVSDYINKSNTAPSKRTLARVEATWEQYKKDNP